MCHMTRGCQLAKFCHYCHFLFVIQQILCYNYRKLLLMLFFALKL